jgi:hypothetical protein
MKSLAEEAEFHPRPGGGPAPYDQGRSLLNDHVVGKYGRNFQKRLGFSGFCF